MDRQDLLFVVLAAVAASALVHGLIALWLQRAIERRLSSLGTTTPTTTRIAGTAGAPSAAARAADAQTDLFSDVAQELVNLARSATDTAMRNEEAKEWHKPNAGGSDEIADVVRDRLRRAAWSAVAARSALTEAVRRNRATIPAALESELYAFCDRLAADDGGTTAERKRRLSADLDALESRFRETLGATRLASDAG